MQLLPDPPVSRRGVLVPGRGDDQKDTGDKRGAIAQLGERLLCKQEVAGSIPAGSTTLRDLRGVRCGDDVRVQWTRVSFLDRTAIEPCRSLTIRKVFVLTLSFQANVFCFFRVLENVAFACAKRYQRYNPVDSLGLYGQVNKRIWWMPWR